jgi:hypothetical protein
MEQNFNEQDAKDLAELWVRRKEGDFTIDEKIEQSVVLMNLVAPPEVQWVFILAAMDRAEGDETLGHLAAGPVEHLLGHHGDAYIERIEAEALRSPRFLRMMSGVWRYMMSDAVWARVQSVQAEAIAASKQV